MMKNEKPGGHGERSVAVGTIDMAIWDLVSKIEEKPLFQMLAQLKLPRACLLDPLDQQRLVEWMLMLINFKKMVDQWLC